MSVILETAKPRCPRHDPFKKRGLNWKWEDKGERGLEQRQCPACMRWYFHGEFGRGWAKGLKVENRINNILN